MYKWLGILLAGVIILVIKILAPKLDAARRRAPLRMRRHVILIWFSFTTILWFFLYRSMTASNQTENVAGWLVFYAVMFLFVGIVLWIGFTQDIQNRALDRWRYNQKRCPWCLSDFKTRHTPKACPQCNGKIPDNAEINQKVD